MRGRPARGSRGFTLIELVVAAGIVALLATVALPLSEVSVQRTKEQELRTDLRQIRGAIDAYKKASDEGRVARAADASGYPPTLEALVEGVPDRRSTSGGKLYFLRRLPRDPVSGEPWGLRSYKSSADDPQPGDDVFDVYSVSTGTGLNGVPYKEW